MQVSIRPLSLFADKSIYLKTCNIDIFYIYVEERCEDVVILLDGHVFKNSKIKYHQYNCIPQHIK